MKDFYWRPLLVIGILALVTWPFAYVVIAIIDNYSEAIRIEFGMKAAFASLPMFTVAVWGLYKFYGWSTELINALEGVTGEDINQDGTIAGNPIEPPAAHNG